MAADLITQPLVSVCIPAYNVEQYIGQAIQSVIDQTYQNIEVIVVDDGSTDNTLQTAKQYEGERVKVLSQQNKGASAARNKCLTEAKGGYIQFLDGDDLLSPDKIAEQVATLLDNPGSIAVCSTVHFNDGDNHIDKQPSPYEETFLIDEEPGYFLLNLYGGFGESGSMVQPNAWLTPIAIIKKAGPWNEVLSLDDDGEYFSRVIAKSDGVIKTNGFNYYRKYRQAKINLSALKGQRHLVSQYQAIQSKINNLQKLHCPPANVNKLHARWLHDLLFKAYPYYPQLVEKLKKDISSLKFNYYPKYTFGTPMGKISNQLFGWKVAKRLQSLKQKLSS